MALIYIRNIPDQSQTIIKINGDDLPINSNYRFILDCESVSDWINKLPDMIETELCTHEAFVEFEGGYEDYKILEAIVCEANKKGYSLKCKRISDNNKLDINLKVRDVLCEIALNEKEFNELDIVLDDEIDIGNIVKKIERTIKEKEVVLVDLKKKEYEIELNGSVESVLQMLSDISENIVELDRFIAKLKMLEKRLAALPY